MESATTAGISLVDGHLVIPCESLTPQQRLDIFCARLDELRTVISELPELKPLSKYREIENHLGRAPVNYGKGISSLTRCLRLGVLERSEFPPTQDGCTLSQRILFLNENGSLVLFGESLYKRIPAMVSLRLFEDEELLELFERRPKALRSLTGTLAYELGQQLQQIGNTFDQVQKVANQLRSLRETLS